MMNFLPPEAPNPDALRTARLTLLEGVASQHCKTMNEVARCLDALKHAAKSLHLAQIASRDAILRIGAPAMLLPAAIDAGEMARDCGLSQLEFESRLRATVGGYSVILDALHRPLPPTGNK